MNNQNLINFNFRQLKTILSLYFFTLGTCLLGLSVYLFLESTNFLEQSITTWSGQSLFWSLLIFFAALFLLFLPIEFFNSFKFVNSSFADLIANITFAILTSLFFLIFFQILFLKLIWYGLSHQKVMANSTVFTLHQKRNYG